MINADAVFVVIGFATGKGHAMVAGHYNNGIFQFPIFLEDGDGTGYKGVEALYFVIVIGHIASYDFMIGEAFKKTDLIQVHTRSLA